MKNIPTLNSRLTPRVVWLLALILLLIFGSSGVYAQTGGDYNLTWWTVANGGSGGGEAGKQVTGGSYELLSTVGQPTGFSSLDGQAYTLQSGFWPGYISDFYTYLPVVVKNFPAAPDLVGSFTLDPPGSDFNSGRQVTINVVVTNQGIRPAGSFWVDFFVNPASTPTVNTRWNDLCSMNPCYGLAWYVSALEPGQSISLSSKKPAEDYSVWPGFFTSGTSTLQLYVDSWNPGSYSGSVSEMNEGNNLYTYPGGVTITGQLTATEVITAPIFPDRPVRLE